MYQKLCDNIIISFFQFSMTTCPYQIYISSLLSQYIISFMFMAHIAGCKNFLNIVYIYATGDTSVE
jgi:hypothetical protein